MSDNQGTPIAPLANLRVLDLTIALAGPYGTRILADLGAEVVKVDTRAERDYATELDLAARLQAMYPNADPGDEPWNRGGFHGQLNRNKHSVALDLGSAEGKEQFLALVETADCLVENFTPKVMPSLGLGHEVLMALNPKLVYVAMPGFGSAGPRSTFPAFAPTTEAASGFLSRLGYDDGTLAPNPMSLADFVGGLNAIVGLMAALSAAKREGQGAFVDLSQVEAMASFIGEEFEEIDGDAEGSTLCQPGNRIPGALLSGAFRSRGHDEWIAITVLGETELRSAAKLAGRDAEDWLRLASSSEGPAKLASCVQEWTLSWDKEELATALQAVGVSASPIQTAPDLFRDSQLAHLGFFVEVEDPSVGRFPYEGQPWHFTRWKGQASAAAPRVGGDTARYVNTRSGDQTSPFQMQNQQSEGKHE